MALSVLAKIGDFVQRPDVRIFLIGYLIGLIIGVLATMFVYKKKCHKTFMNKASTGFYYDTDSLTINSANDRKIAYAALMTKLKQDNYTYTIDQISTLSDEIVLNILEVDDEDSIAAEEAKLIIILDPTYKAALKAIIDARRNNNKFMNVDDRQMIYNLIIKYFTAIDQPVSAPINNWSDFVLIRTFQTLKPPTQQDLAATSSAPPSAHKSTHFDSTAAFAAATAARKTTPHNAVVAMPNFTSMGSA